MNVNSIVSDVFGGLNPVLTGLNQRSNASPRDRNIRVPTNSIMKARDDLRQFLAIDPFDPNGLMRRITRLTTAISKLNFSRLIKAVDAPGSQANAQKINQAIGVLNTQRDK